MSDKKVTASWLKAIKMPQIYIPGILLVSLLGWKQLESYKQSKVLFPQTATVTNIIDGDTFEIKNITVRLLGVDAPANDTKSTNFLKSLILNKKVWLEYDRYKDDKYGRILAWIWIDCESTPTFLPSDYMHKSQNESNPGLLANPIGCLKGKLVQEELIKKNFAITVKYADRGEQKYEKRLGK